MNQNIRVLRCKDVIEKLGISRSSLYDRLKPSSPRFDPSFPQSIHLGANSVGWLEHEIDTWVLEKRTTNSVAMS
ncbi:AlpA family phage regulatory protein [Aeromonas hydrophila]|uniref:AlpA family phage regulatory protein n=1 Tax=Aeromonas hydrophila TaxID=644 RepID=UPI001C056595|nr:AlpA family phage regulatory protein [Aeromonas hydrophila]QWL80764.1 AlpA family phage regulatory protein [Aeromonas hydrophila]